MSSEQEQMSLFDAELQPAPILDTEPRKIARSSDPITSHLAAARLRSGTQKARLLERYRLAGADGLTDDEAAEGAGMEVMPARKRCADLRVEGRIRPIGVVMGRHGTEVRICAIVEEESS